jgi:hypothetical protein
LAGRALAEGEMLDGNPHKFRQRARIELGFELSAGVGYGSA